MPSLCLGWGVAQTAMAACHNYGGLLATRFLLGAIRSELSSLLECHHQSVVSTSRTCYSCWHMVRHQWCSYSRCFSSLLGTGPSKIRRPESMANVTNDEPGPPNTEPLLSIFLFVGLITVASVPFVYRKLDNDIYSPPVSSHPTKVPKPSSASATTKPARDPPNSNGRRSSRPASNRRPIFGSPWPYSSTSALASTTPSATLPHPDTVH